jgi:hypothetical protein
LRTAERDADAAEANAFALKALMTAAANGHSAHADAVARAAAAALAAAALATGDVAAAAAAPAAHAKLAREAVPAAATAAAGRLPSEASSPERANGALRSSRAAVLEAAEEARLLATLEQIEQMSRYNEAANRRRRASWTHRNSLRRSSGGGESGVGGMAAAASAAVAAAAEAAAAAGDSPDEDAAVAGRGGGDQSFQRRVSFPELDAPPLGASSGGDAQTRPRSRHLGRREAGGHIGSAPPADASGAALRPAAWAAAPQPPPAAALGGVLGWAAAALRTAGTAAAASAAEQRHPRHPQFTPYGVRKDLPKPSPALGSRRSGGSGSSGRRRSSPGLRGNTRGLQAVGGVRVGDFVHWSRADLDIPDGAVGLVVGFAADTGRAKCRFPNGTFALRPATLVQQSHFCCVCTPE